ncbi:hypothetical protein ACIPWE_40280 [Streptomyces sp. NPDC090073]|uniref:hypothetical protein n=1 Tax=Streptomyces sp. NPDC090073 TaxID=3365936 RepID=UPI0038167D7E
MSTPNTYTCAISGDESPGKHYVLQSTEGSELVSPEALFHNEADRSLAALLSDVDRRVRALEEKDGGQEEKPAAKKTAAKKTAAGKGES